MFKKIILPAVLVGAMSVTAIASEDVALSDANAEKIRVMLTEQGYEVGKIKMEDGLYEAYARKDGIKYEVYLDADFAIVRTEKDD
ncbi:MAG: PepSY domain-containing protein [Sulfitobacter sp.]